MLCLFTDVSSMILAAAGVTEEETIYSAFLAKEKKEQQRQQVAETIGAGNTNRSNNDSPKKPRVVRKSGLPEKKKERPQSLEEAIATVRGCKGKR